MNQAKMQNIGGLAGGGPGNVQQNNSDVQNGQIVRFVMHQLSQQPPGVGWRAQINVRERLHWTKQMYVSPIVTRLGAAEK